MSEVAVVLGAMELAEKLVELLRAREQARAEMERAQYADDRMLARGAMEAAHAAAVAVHQQLQAALTTTADEPPPGVGTTETETA